MASSRRKRGKHRLKMGVCLFLGISVCLNKQCATVVNFRGAVLVVVMGQFVQLFILGLRAHSRAF